MSSIIEPLHYCDWDQNFPFWNSPVYFELLVQCLLLSPKESLIIEPLHYFDWDRNFSFWNSSVNLELLVLVPAFEFKSESNIQYCDWDQNFPFCNSSVYLGKVGR